MKIMIQDRTMVIEQPRAVWVEQDSDSSQGIVASNMRRAPTLGVYSTPSRAKAVLGEMFEWQRSGKCNFYMPQE